MHEENTVRQKNGYLRHRILKGKTKRIKCGDRIMKRSAAMIVLAIFLLFTCQASGENVSGIRDLFLSPEITATPAPDSFRFRDGIRWGMNTQQVKALEPETMNERIMQDWSVMITEAKVAVSRFAADLIFMFRTDRLLMISYEFQKSSEDDFLYLNGALSSVYGVSEKAEPLKIKALMDAVYPNHYKTELITQAEGWKAADGTAVYLYYYSPDSFAIMYVSPELGSKVYQTNGL